MRLGSCRNSFGPLFLNWKNTTPCQFLVKITWNIAFLHLLHSFICSNNMNIWRVWQEVYIYKLSGSVQCYIFLFFILFKFIGNLFSKMLLNNHYLDQATWKCLFNVLDKKRFLLLLCLIVQAGNLNLHRHQTVVIHVLCAMHCIYIQYQLTILFWKIRWSWKALS